MKENTSQASFSFQTYLIRKFSFFQPESEQTVLSIDFSPVGEYDSAKNVYKLTLSFRARYGEKNDKDLIDLIAEGHFKFSDKTSKEDIPDYFYSNSIAILYPYIRAFVSTITAVSNTKPLVLPTLNLASLAEPLKMNTKVV